MSDLINLYKYYTEMAESTPQDTEENRARNRQFIILSGYVLREIEATASL